MGSGREETRYFACLQSPAAAILEVFEEQNGSLRDLYNIMVAMGRLDCTLVIEGFLNGTSSGHCCNLAANAPSQAGIESPWNMNGKSTDSPQPVPPEQGSCRRELTKNRGWSYKRRTSELQWLVLPNLHWLSLPLEFWRQAA
ncbi:appetite-regulating hormone-like [Platysternon megacephalum]|uniref:Appetite-regulating hormone-like n=1 Tax=Platysternon megacephalum TaxID=55544 RepID=A0A4D9E2G1_9SAUR|nr:appetite-regulating hormone-like [Platysternon megacephalum]